jgi:putative ABC transport system ATP-binding protein
VTEDDVLFSFEQVRFARERREILEIDQAAIIGGGVTAIVGPSGSGKSTLLRFCNRLEVPDSGRVMYRARDVSTIDASKLRRDVGMVFQKATPFGGTLRDNLRVAAPKRGDDDYAALLSRVGLDAAWLDRNAADLSGGEVQRLCMARTLATEPNVVLLDEPTAHLDPVGTQGIESLVLSLARSGTEIVWVSHDPSQVLRVADRVLDIVDRSLVPRSDFRPQKGRHDG